MWNNGKAVYFAFSRTQLRVDTQKKQLTGTVEKKEMSEKAITFMAKKIYKNTKNQD